jgi:hypothetical protein
MKIYGFYDSSSLFNFDNDNNLKKGINYCINIINIDVYQLQKAFSGIFKVD